MRCFHAEQFDKTSQSQLQLFAVSHMGKSLLLPKLDVAEVVEVLLSFQLCLSPNSLSELKANSQQSDLPRQTSYNWFVTLRESQVHFSQICVFLNTDFGTSGSGRDFGRKKLLRSKNRIELLTPPAVQTFLCSWFTFCISVSSLAKKLTQSSEEKKKIRQYFSFRHGATILTGPQTSSKA